jgi:hypothetical protein
MVYDRNGKRIGMRLIFTDVNTRTPHIRRRLPLSRHNYHYVVVKQSPCYEGVYYMIYDLY